MDFQSPEIKEFIWKLLRLVIVTPFAGFALLLSIDEILKAWKTKKFARKWISISIFFFVIAVLLGWLT